MNAVREDVRTDQVFRVWFNSAEGSDGRTLTTFTEPRQCSAFIETLSDDSATLPGRHAVSGDELFVWFLPAGSATPFEVQKQGEAWMAEAEPGAAYAAELVFRGDRILWRPGRALITCAPDRLAELLAGLVEFAFYESELRRLESEIERDWPVAETDVPLTHGVETRDLRRQRHVDEMTRVTTLRRIRLTRLEGHLEKGSPQLPGPARRLVSEMALQSEMLERFRYLDDRMEVFEDLYETANDRLSEYRYYRGEFRLEIWIIVLLVLEVALMVIELLR